LRHSGSIKKFISLNHLFASQKLNQKSNKFFKKGLFQNKSKKPQK